MRRVAGVCVVAFVLVALAGGATASVYDGVAAWWHMDYGASGVIANPNDIRDARDWYNPGGYKATSVLNTPSWTTAGVPAYGPAGGRTLGGRAMEFTPSGSAGGQDGFEVSNLRLGGDHTLFCRFKWDGASTPSNHHTLYSNGFNYGSNLGTLVRFIGSDGSADPAVYYGNHMLTAGWNNLAGNTWYDLAVVFDDNGANDTITFYLHPEGGTLQTAVKSVDWLGGGVDTSQGTRVGYESSGHSNWFSGLMESMAVWDSALSTDEVRAAFGSPDPMWTVGFNTDNNLNFPTESAVDKDYTIGEPWGELPRAVVEYSTTHNHVEVHFDATAEQAALGYVFHLDTDGVRAPGLPLTVAVNGQALGTKTVVANSDHEWYVPSSALNAGSNTLSLQYNGPFIDYGAGGTYATWDWMELSGSWQIGLDNDTSTEFRSEHDIPTDDFYVTDRVWDAGDNRWEWPNFEQAVSAGDTDTYIHFALSDEMTKYSYLLSFEALWAENSETAFDVSLNGVNILASSGALGLYEVPIPWGSYLMQAGDNVIQFEFTDTRPDHRWIVWDWVRLEVQNDQAPEPATLSLLGLGGLALLRRRRK